MCRQIKAEGYTLTYFSEGEARDAVYCPLSPEEGEAVWELLPSPRPVLGAVGGLDWNRDLSPWPAPGAFGKGTDFAGKGGAFLTLLTEVLIPQGEKMMDFHPRRRALAGIFSGRIVCSLVSYSNKLFSAGGIYVRFSVV